MKTLENSPLADVYVPYIQAPEVKPVMQLRFLWEAIRGTRLPFMTRWMIYQAFRAQ